MENSNLQIDSNITKDLDAIHQGQLSPFELGYNPDVLDCLSSLSNDEVFTSPKLANQMLDLLPNELWSNPKATFLDPVCKSGVFLREIVKRLDKGLKNQIPDKQTRINHILKHQVFGIAITGLTALLSRRSVYCSKVANSPLSICEEFDNDMGNIIFGAVHHHFKDGKCSECGASQEVFGNRDGLENHAYAFIHSDRDDVFGELLTMKFDVIIGNPPYQLKDEKDKKRASASPIYHYFVEQAKKLNPRYLVMITPSRWFTGGKGLDTFRDSMLNDRRIKEIHDFPNSKDCFDNVEIKGGVNYFLWEKRHDGDCEVFTYDDGHCVSQLKRPLKEKGTDVFIRFNQAVSILRKLRNKSEKSFGELVSVQTPFGFLSSFNDYKNKKFENSVSLITSKGERFISREQINRNEHLVDKYKVYIAKAYGERISSNFWVLGKPFLGDKNSCCTQTYLVVGAYDDVATCQNVISYMQTRFFRFLVMLKKQTQDAMRGTYKFVPMQDFSKSWTDNELYLKYGLNRQEIEYIEYMVREMANENISNENNSRAKKAKQADLLEGGDE